MVRAYLLGNLQEGGDKGGHGLQAHAGRRE